MTEVSLTGRLLVASPALTDPNFDRTVVLLLDHSADGALGVVINRPTPVYVTEVLPPWSQLATEPPVVFQGGPVALDSALALAAVPGGGEPMGWRRVHGAVGLVDLDAPPELLAGERSCAASAARSRWWRPTLMTPP
jgi:putative transcriptional regulator